jgi:hypothetical protein
MTTGTTGCHVEVGTAAHVSEELGDDMSTLEHAAAGSASERVRAIAVEAYLYLYPLVTMELTRRQMTNAPVGTRPGFAPVGVFAHIRQFPPAGWRTVVRPNFDTLYSSVWLDLSDEPMIVSVPDTDGRYYLLPFLDMWTDVFAVPGKRTSGTSAAHYALVPPGWQGAAPDGVELLQAPTAYVWGIGRTQTDGPADYAAVQAIQDGLGVTPLSRWGDAPVAMESRVDRFVDMETPPLEQVDAMAARDYFELAAELLAKHPPHLTDWSTLARIRRIGLIAGAAFDYDALDGDARKALDAAPAEAAALMEAALPRVARIVNGWRMTTEGMGVYGNDYLKRAIITMTGLGANQPEDAIYPLNVADADGRPLDGDHDYVMRFERDELPPVDAFWSVTMYDAKGFQAANAIDRFAIGDRDDLHYNDDGSLDLWLQHDDPGSDRRANWLPAPHGSLGVTMRLYAPRLEALDGRWSPPAIRRRTA